MSDPLRTIDNREEERRRRRLAALEGLRSLGDEIEERTGGRRLGDATEMIREMRETRAREIVETSTRG